MKSIKGRPPYMTEKEWEQDCLIKVMRDDIGIMHLFNKCLVWVSIVGWLGFMAMIVREVVR